MALKDVLKDIEGYREIVGEIQVLRKYGSDYSSSKGVVEHIISLLHPKRITLKLSEVLTETSSSKTFRFAAKGGYLPPFQAGQYVNIFVDVHGIRTSRPYSISSAPTQLGYYDITIRNVEDGFVSGFFLDEVTVGSEFEATSPSGNFIYNPLFHGKDLVFLAGGSGVTPFMSMIREVADRGLSRRIHLIYGSRNPDDVIFSSELRAITEKHTNISCSLVISNPPKGYRGLTGFITAELMKKILGDVSAKTFYLCGPDAMYAFCLSELEKLGIPRRKIRTEVYGPPKDVTTQPGWPRDVKPADVFTVKIKGDKAIPAQSFSPAGYSSPKG
jgi:ferredoxin-NADP reductase